ncbi:TetR/AcrR family transcriptional regulator [Xinfangfangia sp. D13-10-4-6]|uniref:TetR/AcrR family transcriptional regulator n=1 Tax=Pseudogemmobacter hezensis TaxID=2737662 RepID=UPI0015578577|nr:TetR/AcrR family transcriptional regulator [Pseudogemmobacter hezensis]NPD16490.1 TetR/AcrR family transcriptional regulator [Pseudogemmobacter hezensis]
MTQTTLTPKATATRRHILETGHALVLHKGFSGLGLQEILANSGVPKGSFYHYFASKEAFGTTLLHHYVETYSDRLTQLLATPGTGHDRLMRYFRAWISDPGDPSCPGWAEGCLVVKLSAEVADLSEDMRLVLQGGVTRLINRTAALIIEGRDDGSLPEGADAARLAQVIYQMWLGAALLARLSRSPAPMAAALSATETLLACPASPDPGAMP